MHPRFALLPSFLCLALLTTQAAGDPPRTDRYGDPLPHGAVFRIGTTRLRAVSDYKQSSEFKNLLFSPDGKFLLSSAAGESNVCMWETATGREVRRFASGFRDGHTFALSSDGAVLAVCNGEEIHLYDTASGKKRRTIPLAPQIYGLPHALAFSPDGKGLVLRHWDPWGERDKVENGIRRWDIATGKMIGSWKMGADAPLAFSADTRFVASVREKDPHIRLWETASGKKIREWKGAGKVPLEDRWLIFSPDGRSLVAAGRDTMIREYEVAAGKEVRSWKVFKRNKNFRFENSEKDEIHIVNFLGQLAFAPDGKTLASVDYNFVLQLWDWKTGRELRSFEGAAIDGPVAFSHDGKIFAAGGRDSRIHLWETATGRDLCPFPDPGEITGIAFAPDGRMLAVDSKDQVRLLDSASSRLLKRPDYRSLTFTPDGRSLLVQRRDGPYCLLDAGSRNLPRVWSVGSPIGWNPDKKRLVTFDNGSVGVWDTATGKKLWEWHAEDFSASCSPNGRTVAIADEKNAKIHLFETDTGRELHQLTGYSERVDYGAHRGNSGASGGGSLFPALSPDGKVVLAGCDRNSFGLWDVSTGKRFLRFRFEQFLPHNPIFTPNGDLLALLDTHGDPCLVDAATGRLRHRLTWKGGDLGWILESVRAFSPDGRLLAAAYDPRTLVLWETATGRPIHTWPGHGRGELRQMVFSSDSRRLATVGTDGTALVWDVTGLSPDGQLPARKLTPAETKQVWKDLADADAAKAHRALWSLVADPARALPLLREHLHPTPGVDPRRLTRLIADLDSDDFTVRETATRELRKLGELAEPALRAALKDKPSLELRRRVQGLLEEIDSTVPPAESLRGLRAVAVLEHIANTGARQLLGVLAEGAPGARLTREAKASLARLRSRRVQP